MSGNLWISNRQRTKGTDLRYLRRLVRHLLQDELRLDEFDISIYLLGDAAMVKANESYLKHQGTTDVITFDYGDATAPALLAGELLVCVPEAQRQARKFRTSWQSEIVRYIVHGILHLQGFDDATVAKRKKMKAQENRLVRRLGTLFRFERISGTHSPR